ncbi:hypothetical protein [Methanosarcina sp. WH1]|nr:hypothetical protein [Methanosarcina sp. WH1]AKB21172.1 Acetyl-CoA synthetase (ADP-forming) alpha chain [Methanosarcina sp. WH1]
MASAFTATGMPVFFSPESVVRAAAVLCGGKWQAEIKFEPKKN